jgi:hypothetical protein
MSIMPLQVKVESERGERIEEYFPPAWEINELLPLGNDAWYCCWRFSEQYGHTVLNRIQMKLLVSAAPTR